MVSSYPPSDDDGLCPVCGRDLRCGRDGVWSCPCCKTCGCINTPCECDFDLSTAEGRRDFEKYGEAFVAIDTETALTMLPPLPFKPVCEKCSRERGESCQSCGHDVGTQCECCDRCGPGFSIQMRRYLQYNVQPPPPSLRYMDAIDDRPHPPQVALTRVVFCNCRLPVVTPIDKATSYEKCVLREYHDGEHQLQDGRRWPNERCIARVKVHDEKHSPVQCDKGAGHDGDHVADRGDGVELSAHWEWPDDHSIPTWIPRAYAQPAKKRTLLSIVREFFAKRRHIRPPEGPVKP